MRRRTAVLIGVAATVIVLGSAVVVVGPVLYAGVVNASADAAPSLAPTGGGSLAPTDATGTWHAGGDSFAGYRVHEVLRGQDVHVVGRTSEVTAEVDVARGSMQRATVTVQVADISTPESARDAYFRSTALQTERYPTATFTLGAPVDLPAAAGGSGGRGSGIGGSARVRLTGALELHGVTEQVSFPATVGLHGSGPDATVQVVGSIPVAFADYGVRAPDLGFVRVDDHGAVEFSLDLAKG